MNKELFLERDIKYQVELVKQASTFNNTVLVLVDRFKADLFLEEWALVENKLNKLSNFTKSTVDNSEVNISCYLENLSYLDTMYGGQLQRYFTKFLRFPYSVINMKGTKHFDMKQYIFSIWYSMVEGKAKEWR
jgi:hypothetical protein